MENRSSRNPIGSTKIFALVMRYESRTMMVRADSAFPVWLRQTTEHLSACMMFAEEEEAIFQVILMWECREAPMVDEAGNRCKLLWIWGTIPNGITMESAIQQCSLIVQQAPFWVAATWSHGNRSWRGSGPGLLPEETGQLMLVKSDDDGKTWSKPMNITKQVKRPEWCFLLQGPGKGITMRDGTIVFAAQFQDTPENNRLPRSSIIYSKDHGKTWQMGTGAYDDTTEAQVVEIEPGVLMLNCRYNRQAKRVVMITRDMGKTWQEHSTSRKSLIEPGSCMASLIHVEQELTRLFKHGPKSSKSDSLHNKSLLLFSNPNSTRGRNHITIKASLDNGKTWPPEKHLLLDEGLGAGYSCMSIIDRQTVGILYEGSMSQLAFQRISLKDILAKKSKRPETLPKNKKSTLTLPQVFGNHMVLQAGKELPVWDKLFRIRKFMSL